MGEKKCEFKTSPKSICGAPGLNPCRQHSLHYTQTQLKHSDTTIKIVESILKQHHRDKKPFADTLETIERILENHNKGKAHNEQLQEDFPASF